ncbi:MAG: hypothetical protein HY319_30630 [Armatimonadetes bacterium]|nr:hypothetical protein [Armatimonadota bacterium]
MMDRDSVRQYLAGQQKVWEHVKEERRQKLRCLTREEARREYDALCQVWYSQPRQPAVDRSHLEALLRVRRAMQLQARGKDHQRAV